MNATALKDFYEYAITTPNASVQEMMQCFNCSKSTVFNWIKVLTEGGLIRRVKKGRRAVTEKITEWKEENLLPVRHAYKGITEEERKENIRQYYKTTAYHWTKNPEWIVKKKKRALKYFSRMRSMGIEITHEDLAMKFISVPEDIAMEWIIEFKEEQVKKTEEDRMLCEVQPTENENINNLLHEVETQVQQSNLTNTHTHMHKEVIPTREEYVGSSQVVLATHQKKNGYQNTSGFFFPNIVSKVNVLCTKAWIREWVNLKEFMIQEGEWIHPRINGKGESSGLCPFHEDTHPSMTVNVQKGIWYCFTCKTTGDVIEYVQQKHQLRYGDAMRYILQKVHDSPSLLEPSTEVTAYEAWNYRIDRYHNKARVVFTSKDYVRFEKISTYKNEKDTINNDEKAEWERIAKQYELYKQSLNTDAWVYLKSRGITEEAVQVFGLGYDRKRNAIVFPNRTADGKVSGFTYRYIKPKNNIRYVNSSEYKGSSIYSGVYKKREILIGYTEVKVLAIKLKKIYLVEGPFDSVLGFIKGIPAVGMQNADLTDEQAELLLELASQGVQIIHLPDNDLPGIESIEPIKNKLIGMALQKNIKLTYSVNTTLYKGYKDLAEFLENNLNECCIL